MDYNEMAKFVNELNWKITYLILGLSIGVIAFSIQDLSKNVEYECLLILFISWSLLGASFIISIFRLHHSIAVATRNAAEFFNKEYGDKDYKLDKNKIQKTNRNSAVIYWIMMFLFLTGVIGYAIFKVINL